MVFLYPPGRLILQVAHDVVLVDLLWCPDSVVTGGADMPDAEKVQESARVAPIEKKAYTVSLPKRFTKKPKCASVNR